MRSLAGGAPVGPDADVVGFRGGGARARPIRPRCRWWPGSRGGPRPGGRVGVRHTGTLLVCHDDPTFLGLLTYAGGNHSPHTRVTSPWLSSVQYSGHLDS